VALLVIDKFRCCSICPACTATCNGKAYKNKKKQHGI
jgi:hypothetical protein